MASATQMVPDADFVGIDIYPISVVKSGEIMHLNENPECKDHVDSGSGLQAEEVYENDFSTIERNCVEMTPTDQGNEEYDIEAMSNIDKFEENIPTELSDDFDSTGHYCNESFFFQESSNVFRNEGLTRMYNLDTIYENLQENLDTITEVQLHPNQEISEISNFHSPLNEEYIHCPLNKEYIHSPRNEEYIENACISQDFFSQNLGSNENLFEQCAPISTLQHLIPFCEGTSKIKSGESNVNMHLNTLCAGNEQYILEGVLKMTPELNKIHEVVELRGQVACLSPQNDAWASEKHQIEEEKSCLKQELQEVKIKLTEANSQQSERDERIAKLKDEIIELQRHIQNLDDQLKSAFDKNLEHSSNISQTEAINADLRKKLEGHAKDLTKLQETETKLHEALQENADLKELIDKLQVSLQKVEKDKITEIEILFEKGRLAEIAWTEDRSNFQKLLTEESGKCLELQNKINMLKEEKDQLLKLISLLSTEKSKQEDELKVLSERIEQLERITRDCKALREENHSLKEDSSRLKEEVEKLLLQDNKNNEEISVLKNDSQLLLAMLNTVENEKLAFEKTNTHLSESLRRQMLKVKKTRNMFKKYIQFLNADRVSMVRKYKKTKNRYHSLRSDLHCYKSLVEEMEREILTQKEEIDRANDAITQHQLEEADLKKITNQFQATICNLQETHKLAVNEMNFLHSEMSVARERMEQVNQEKLKLEIFLKDRDSHISKLQKDIACLTDTLHIYNVRQRNLETSFELLKEDLTNVRMGFSEAQKELEYLEAKTFEVESLCSNLESENFCLKAEQNSTIALYEKKLEEAANKFVNISNELRYQHQLLAEYRQENDCLKDTLQSKKKKFFTLDRRPITPEQEYKSNNSSDNQLKPTNILSTFFSKIFHTNRKYKVNQMNPAESKDTVSLTEPSEKISKNLNFN